MPKGVRRGPPEPCPLGYHAWLGQDGLLPSEEEAFYNRLPGTDFEVHGGARPDDVIISSRLS